MRWLRRWLSRYGRERKQRADATPRAKSRSMLRLRPWRHRYCFVALARAHGLMTNSRTGDASGDHIADLCLRTIHQDEHLRWAEPTDLYVRDSARCSAHRDGRSHGVCHAAAAPRRRLRGVRDDRHYRSGGIESCVDEDVRAARLGGGRVDDAERLLVVEDPRPGDEFSRPARLERPAEERGGSQVLASLTKHGRAAPAGDEVGDADVCGML